MGLKKYEKTRDDSAETESPVSEFYYGGEHYQRQDWRRRACDSNPNDRRLGMYEAGGRDFEERLFGYRPRERRLPELKPAPNRESEAFFPEKEPLTHLTQEAGPGVFV